MSHAFFTKLPAPTKFPENLVDGGRRPKQASVATVLGSTRASRTGNFSECRSFSRWLPNCEYLPLSSCVVQSRPAALDAAPCGGLAEVGINNRMQGSIVDQCVYCG